MSPQLQDTLGMFVFLAVELSVLFIGISALVGVLQRHIPPAKVEALLSSTGTRGYLLAAGLGAITPFCSCSTIDPSARRVRSDDGVSLLLPAPEPGCCRFAGGHVRTDSHIHLRDCRPCSIAGCRMADACVRFRAVYPSHSNERDRRMWLVAKPVWCCTGRTGLRKSENR